MARFPHLQLKRKSDGLYRPKKGGGKKEVNLTTKANLTTNRDGHGGKLLSSIGVLSNYWENNLQSREAQNLPELPDSGVVPVYLQVDTQVFDAESLKILR